MPEHPPSEIASSPPSPALQVTLLGTPAVRWAGRPVAISRRQVRALLYRLAASREPVPREQLCFLFWPDVPEMTARRKLSGLLAHLRRTLPDAEALLTRDDHVGLEPDRTWSDLLTFEALCGSQPSQRKELALQQAVELYRGPFLDGFSLPDGPEYETWMAVERGSCERAYLEALAVLIDKEVGRGAYEAAIAYAQKYLETDDLAEEIHRRLIEFYTATGGRSAALRQFEHCVAVLERELGVEPLPETRAAYQSALESKGPRLAPDTIQPQIPAHGEARAEEEVAPTWTTRPGLDVELVGREKTLEQLARAFSRIQEGRGEVLLISGEPGIGKSRLMQEFAASLGDQALVLSGAGYPDTQASPYQPLVEALRPALLAYHSRLHVPDWCHAEAFRLVPEIRPFHPELSTATVTGSEQAQATLFEALYQILLGLAAIRRPVLFCLDDLHWASGTTMNWLAYAGRKLALEAHARVLIVGAYRSEDSSAVKALREGLARQGTLAELALAGLDEAEILQLLKPLEDSLPCDQELVSYLRHATGGNPFLLLESVRSLIDAGCQPGDLTGPDGLHVPDTILDAIEARVAGLSPTARQVLEAGAVLGRSFSLGLVQRTSGRREMETVDGLDEIVAEQLVDEGSTGYWFRHEIIQAAVYRQLSHHRQEILHRRAGEALQRLEPSDTAALARHFERGGQPGRAAPYALRAGRVAKEVFAQVEALAFFDKALELLEWEAVDLQDPAARVANQRLRVEALFERGWALRLVGDMEAYARDGEEVLRLARSLGDSRSLAHSHWREAYAHRWFCRYREARASAEEGVRLSQETADLRLEAMCRREVGLAARAMGDSDLAQTELERALELFAGLGETVYEVHTMGNLATLYWHDDDCQQALDLSHRALERCEAAGLRLERRLPLGDLGAAAAAMDDKEMASRCLEESLSISRQAGDRTQQILCLTHLGWLGVRQSNPETALEHLLAGLALAQQIGSCTEQGWLHAGLAEAYRLGGEREEAIVHAQRALALAQETGAAYDLKLANQVLNKLRDT